LENKFYFEDSFETEKWIQTQEVIILQNSNK